MFVYQPELDILTEYVLYNKHRLKLIKVLYIISTNEQLGSQQKFKIWAQKLKNISYISKFI